MSDEDDTRPIGEVLRGLHLAPLPEGWTPLECTVLVKCLDADGDPTWAVRTTPGLNDEERLGALTVQADLLRKELADTFIDDL